MGFKLRQIIFLFFVFSYFSLLSGEKVDLIVFSYNRPLQLDAFLRSLYLYGKGIGSVSIIYRADKGFDQAYTVLIKKFYVCKFIRQSSYNPRSDFKKLTVDTLNKTTSNFLAFAVDDLIVKDEIDFEFCTSVLEKTNTYGFFLRLGKNIVESYMERRHTGMPPLQFLGADIYSWQFLQGQGDWRYPNSVDMTIYRKSDIKPILEYLSYNSPNTLEGTWAAHADLTKRGTCFGFSKVVNLPINMVQQDFANPHMHHVTVYHLLDIFNRGFVLDIAPLYKIHNKAPHMNYFPSYKNIRLKSAEKVSFYRYTRAMRNFRG